MIPSVSNLEIPTQHLLLDLHEVVIDLTGDTDDEFIESHKDEEHYVLSIDPARNNTGLAVYAIKAKKIVKLSRGAIGGVGKVEIALSVRTLLDKLCGDFKIMLILVERQLKFAGINNSINIVTNNVLETAIVMYGCMRGIQTESIESARSIRYLEERIGLPTSFKCTAKDHYSIKKAKAVAYLEDLLDGKFAGNVSITENARSQAKSFNKKDDIGDAFCQLYRFF